MRGSEKTRSRPCQVFCLLMVMGATFCCGCARESRTVTATVVDSAGNEELQEIRLTSDIASFRHQLRAIVEDAFSQWDSQQRSKAVSLTVVEPLEMPAEVQERASQKGVSMTCEQTVRLGPYWLVRCENDPLPYSLVSGPFSEWPYPGTYGEGDSPDALIDVVIDNIHDSLSIHCDGVPPSPDKVISELAPEAANELAIEDIDLPSQ